MTTFALEVKELPGQNPAAPPPTNPVHNTEAPAWSGDVYQEGDESTPEQSEWSFTGEGGEEAWLDRSQDGTITGWVRDPDGTVYRYTDPDAWAVDVDDAGMARQGGAEAPVEGGGGEDPNAATDPAQGDEFVDPDQPEVDEDAAYDEYASDGDYSDEDADPDVDPEDEPEGEEEADTDEPEPEADAETDPEGEPAEEEEDEDSPPFKKKGKVEGKVLHLPYR